MNTTERTETMSTGRAVWTAVKFGFYVGVALFFAYSFGYQMAAIF